MTRIMSIDMGINAEPRPGNPSDAGSCSKLRLIHGLQEGFEGQLIVGIGNGHMQEYTLH